MIYHKNKFTFLAVIFAVILFSGSIPLGFSTLPVLPTLQELAPECNNSEHVQVLRDNYKFACVKETTAQKLGWEILVEKLKIEPIIPLTYDFLISHPEIFVQTIEEDLGEYKHMMEEEAEVDGPATIVEYGKFSLGEIAEIIRSEMEKFGYSHKVIYDSIKDFKERRADDFPVVISEPPPVRIVNTPPYSFKIGAENLWYFNEVGEEFDFKIIIKDFGDSCRGYNMEIQDYNTKKVLWEISLDVDCLDGIEDENYEIYFEFKTGSEPENIPPFITASPAKYSFVFNSLNDEYVRYIVVAEK